MHRRYGDKFQRKEAGKRLYYPGTWNERGITDMLCQANFYKKSDSCPNK